MPAKEWDEAFLNTINVASLGLGVFSIAMAILQAQRNSPLAQRAYSQDGKYLVSVRFPGEWSDLRDFIQPSDPEVASIYRGIGPDYWALYDFVCRNVDYRTDFGEFWQLPGETLRGAGDCEDTSILLTSLLRNFTNAHVALGVYQGYGHAWCLSNGQLLETTYTFARPVPDAEDYCPYAYFNEQEVVELWPGALQEVFELRRDEISKLQLIGVA